MIGNKILIETDDRLYNILCTVLDIKIIKNRIRKYLYVTDKGNLYSSILYEKDIIVIYKYSRCDIFLDYELTHRLFKSYDVIRYEYLSA